MVEQILCLDEGNLRMKFKLFFLVSVHISSSIW